MTCRKAGKIVAERTHALQSERRELLATREVLRQQATRDGLTGLLNRTAILEVLNREWKRAERERTGLAVIIADVDHFKRFNEPMDTSREMKSSLPLPHV